MFKIYMIFYTLIMMSLLTRKSHKTDGNGFMILSRITVYCLLEIIQNIVSKEYHATT